SRYLFHGLLLFSVSSPRRPPPPPLFPYTTLFRSGRAHRAATAGHGRRPPRLHRAHRPSRPPPRRSHPFRSVHPFVVLRPDRRGRSEEHTSELQSRENLVCRLLLEKKKTSSAHV